MCKKTLLTLIFCLCIFDFKVLASSGYYNEEFYQSNFIISESNQFEESDFIKHLPSDWLSLEQASMAFHSDAINTPPIGPARPGMKDLRKNIELKIKEQKLNNYDFYVDNNGNVLMSYEFSSPDIEEEKLSNKKFDVVFKNLLNSIPKLNLNLHYFDYDKGSVVLTDAIGNTIIVSVNQETKDKTKLTAKGFSNKNRKKDVLKNSVHNLILKTSE